MPKSKKYDSSFTAGGLLHKEFNAISTLLDKPNFVERMIREKELNKLIAIPTESARKRIIQEIIKRYNSVDSSFWNWYLIKSIDEQKLALFYLCLRTYPLLFDLHFEVGLKKFKTGNNFDSGSIQMRLDEIASRDEEVGSWSNKTLDKVNSRYRSILYDCGLLKNETLTSPINISDSFFEYFEENKGNWFAEICFK